MPKAKAGDVIDADVRRGRDGALKAKDSEVRLVGFGTFSDVEAQGRHRAATRAPARRSRSPPRTTVRFKPGKSSEGRGQLSTPTG